MGQDERHKQKQLMKKRQKDKQRKKTAAAGQALSHASAFKTVMQARKLPIHECLINSTWKEHGLANIILSRRQGDGNLVFGAYLVDLQCLGVKTSFCNADVSPEAYGTRLLARAFPDGDGAKCPIALAHHIIYGAIDYAAKYGFSPHEDFRLAEHVLEPRETFGPPVDVEFGKDGKPFYVSGPRDNPGAVIAQLERTAGEGNYDYIARIG